MTKLLLVALIISASILTTSVCLAGGVSADIFVFAGQSNIQVNATTTKENAPAEILNDPGVQIWDSATRKFVTYEIGVNSMQPIRPQNGGIVGNWGPEAQFSFLMRKASPTKPVYIVKFGIGATQLAKSDKLLDWSPWSPKNELFGLTETAIAEAKAELIKRGQKPVVRAVIWMQGENDTEGAIADSYYDNLRDWASSVRARWAEPDTELIIGKIFTAWGTAENNKKIVDAQVKLSTSLPNVILISNDQSPHGPHFLPAGAIKFGSDIYQAYIDRH